MIDMKHRQIFLSKCEALIECFPALKSRPKLERIYLFLKDLPAHAIDEIFNTVIDNFKYAPTPNDFKDASSSWKKVNNYYPLVLENPIPICSYCRNSGIVRIQSHNEPKADQLMKCKCEESCRAYMFKLPQFDYSLKQVYEIGPCPLEWFKPKDLNPSGKEFKNLQNIYMGRIKNSEKHWKELGF